MKSGAGTDPGTPFNLRGNVVNERAGMPGSALDVQEPLVAGRVTLREVGAPTAVRAEAPQTKGDSMRHRGGSTADRLPGPQNSGSRTAAGDPQTESAIWLELDRLQHAASGEKW